MNYSAGVILTLTSYQHCVKKKDGLRMDFNRWFHPFRFASPGERRILRQAGEEKTYGTQGGNNMARYNKHRG